MAELPESLAVDQIGAVGNFVSAMLQTAGLDGQSVVLNYFSPIIEQVGVLFYLVAIITAMICILLFGEYRKGIYLFVAPAVFIFMLKTTVSPTGTLVRFGNRTVEQSPNAQHKMINMFIGGDRASPTSTDDQRISWFYAVYDNLVTSVVQGLVSFLLDTENREDLMIAGRERVYSNLLQAESNDPKFIKLLAVGLMGQCVRPTVVGNEAARVSSSDSATRDMRSELSQQRLNEAKNTLINLDHELGGYLIDQKIINNFDEIVNGVSCHDIWGYVNKAAHNEATLYRKKQKAQQKETAGEDGIPEETWEEIWKEVDEAIGKDAGSESVDNAKVNDVLAAILIRNNLLKNPQSQLTAQIFKRTPFNNAEESMIYENMAGAESTGMTAKLVYFAAIIPYIQGLFLMVLTVVFPFFCVFLLMPGRFMAFFMWMTMWLWVKSWDVGFAVIVFLKDFFWQFLSRDISHNVKTVNWDDPSDIFEFIATKDPIANPNTYSTILSILTVAVPLLTSELCMGANGLASIFKSSTQSLANRFGSQHTKGASRGVASDGQHMLGREYSLVQSASAMNSFNNPGQTRSGVDRAKTFNETQALRIGNQADYAKWLHINSPEGSAVAWATAGANNRATEPISNQGKVLPAATGNAANENLSAETGWNSGLTLLPKPTSYGQGKVKGHEPAEGDN